MKQEEIEAVFIHEQVRFANDVAICQFHSAGDRKPISGGSILTAKVQCEPRDLQQGLSYRLWGAWRNHYKYGRQFHAQTWIPVQPLPHDEAGTVVYLQQAPWVGKVAAKSLWREYQGDAVRKLREAPREASESIGMKSFTVARAEEAAAYLEEMRATEDASIALMSLVAKRGFPRTVVRRALRKWGNRAAELVRRNPYLLMQLRGCGFSRCDELYLDLGYHPARLKRIALCIWHAISRDMSGSTWFRPEKLAEHVRAHVTDPADIPRAVKLGLRGHLLAKRRDGDGRLWLTEAGRAQAELTVAECVERMNRGQSAWPSVHALDISDHQKEELQKATATRIGIFAGGPGTGKTFSAAHLIREIISSHTTDQVAVVAPTGKAAVRITEALQSHGIGLRARTIHSYLKVTTHEEGHRSGHKGPVLGAGEFSFEHHAENPVEERFVVCDEASMNDVELMGCLVSALPDNGHLLLVGDLGQLPPVGHGAPLRDLTTAGIGRGELTEIRRNAGLIVETCRRIRECESLEFPEQLNPTDGVNLSLKRARDANQALELIVQTIRHVRERQLMDPVWDVQVVVAVNQKSPIARKHVNKLLQAELNGANRSKAAYWENDKIVCLKNSFFPVATDQMEALENDSEDWDGLVHEREEGREEFYVANGEIGRVLNDTPTLTLCEFTTPTRCVVVPKSNDSGMESRIDLAYAISAHKSQGSEWPLVLVALDDHRGARMVCDRSWLYTAISRAKDACILIGKEETAVQMCREQKISLRKTLLVETIEELSRTTCRTTCRTTQEREGDQRAKEEQRVEEEPLEKEPLGDESCEEKLGAEGRSRGAASLRAFYGGLRRKGKVSL